MKKYAVLLIIISVLFIGCSKERVAGSGSIITQERSETNFTGIRMSGANNVHVTKGAFRVQVKGYSNLLTYYETRIINGNLEVGYRGNIRIKNDNIEVYVTMPSINMLSISGAGSIDALGNFDANNALETNISGSGNISFQQGSAKNFTSTISGSGNVSAFGVIAEKANINISGSGNTEVTATSQLEVTISGSGDVYYKGTPVITSHISGSGSIIPR